MNYDMYDIKRRVAFLHEFVTRKDTFAQQMGNGGYRKITEVLTDDMLVEHEDGIITLGFYQMYNEGKVRWVCYDLDTHGDESPEHTLMGAMLLRERLDLLELPYLVEASGSDNSYHIWIMLDETDVFKAYHWSRDIVSDLELDCEIFPKQSKPMEYGNLVKLPLAYNRKSERWSKIVNKDMNGHVNISRINIDSYEPTLTEVEHRTTSTTNFSGVQLSGLKPCIKQMIEDNVQMTGTQGHAMRIAVVAELSNSGWTFDDICKVFQKQMDYDDDMTRSQVQSVLHYNRMRCATLRIKCSTFIKCKGCKYNGCE